MAQPHPHHHQAFGYSSSSSVHQSFDTCDSGELLGLQAGMEMLSLPTNSLFPTQISSSSQGLLSLSLSHPHPENLYHHHHQQHHHQDEGGFYQSYQLRNSVYLRPAQELLNEFCGLDVGSSSSSKQKQKARKDDQQDHDATSSSSTWNQSLPTMDLLELQKRKALLLSMLEEVDRKYKKYCEQMQGVVSSFEEVVGEGSATVYSRLASRAMSKHFRCLRDGIVDQLKTTKYYKVKVVMGEKDASTVGSGTTKRVTPRLRMLDQCLRQQKAHSAGLLESQPWRPQRGLPERSVTILRAWLFEHFLHPYPSDVDKHILARQTGLSKSQVSNWFINARVRLWKPMVEEMYMQETKDQDDDDDNNHQSDNDIDNNSPPSNQNPNLNPSSSYDHQDQKPQRAAPAHHHLQIDDPDLNFGVVDLDFSPYNNNNNNNNNNNQGFGNGVSLTLGLQQSLFFTREQMEVLDGDLQAQNLPYRDSIGSHLLHDLA